MSFSEGVKTALETVFFSSSEPVAHGELLCSLNVRRASRVVRRQKLIQRTSPPKLLAGF